MFRSPRDALDVLRRLNDCGVNLHVIAWTATSPTTASASWSSAVAEAECDQSRERITEAKRDQRKRAGATWAARCHSAGASAPAAHWKRCRRSRRRSDGWSAGTRKACRCGRSPPLAKSRVEISHMGVKNALAGTSGDASPDRSRKPASAVA